MPPAFCNLQPVRWASGSMRRAACASREETGTEQPL